MVSSASRSLTLPLLPQGLQDRISILGLDVEGIKLFVIVTAVVSMVGLWFFVNRSKTGRAIRAVSEDKEIAGLMGIDVSRVIVTTFAVGGAMAGVARSPVGNAVPQGLLSHRIPPRDQGVHGCGPRRHRQPRRRHARWGDARPARSFRTHADRRPALGRFRRGPGSPSPSSPSSVRSWAGASCGSAVPSRLGAGLGYIFFGAIGVVLGLVVLPGSTVVIPGAAQFKDMIAFLVLIGVLMIRPIGLLGERLAVEERV